MVLSRYSRRTIASVLLELGRYSAGIWIVLSILVVSQIFRLRVVLWSLLGLAALTLAVGLARGGFPGFLRIDWPRPETRLDKVTSSVAYTCSLGFGTIGGETAYRLSDRWVLAGIGAAFLSIWTLKHLYLFIYLFDNSTEI